MTIERMPMEWGLRSGAAVAAVVALFGGYLVADAYDVVPGMLTTAAPWPEPSPFPSAPGAVDGPAPAALLEDLPDDAPVPDSVEMQRLVSDLAKDKRLGSRIGVVVADGATGQVLGSSSPDKLMTPASTQKLFTGVAALSSSIADSTLDTKAVLVGDNTVVLVGGGDMMLSEGKGDPNAVNGRAGLADLAQQVAAKIKVTGATEVRVALDDTLFTGDQIAPTVASPNIAAGYIAPVSSVGVNVGLLSDGYTDNGPRASDPGKYAAEAFSAALEDQGLTTAGAVIDETAPDDARVLGEVSSAPLAEVVGFAMQYSDNTITEVLGRLVAVDAGLPGSNDGATQAVIAAAKRLGVDMTGARLRDCSGLGDGSYLSGQQLTDLLGVMVDPAQPELRSEATGMPIAGLSGTLDSTHGRFTGLNPARGLARAKTGSLPKVRALAGTVVTADDRLLVFSVLADSIPAKQTVGATSIYDAFVGDLAAYSAQG
ncbi:D-alanyl-D-alanine carboxypeptidase/D-alanyl-D-alanine-endopeptidase [Promicromonospora sukumoe]|uniref:D-alanyl-D-alanine carboxypeptidase/D-alanyl-D-alanine-endopeptidase (Penicillin-binding protein 4) n=1 Tax=Promicromonospora sukumoe TaxID=88382 RepID=A0A7W3PG52_9MICO|nr:D-alanyl-D-alanine carboxypeptidase/D-alanyl-D-alanine-endopeptidase [Promicromonospora sukumoe]MBA8810431.1 D-alanyl-D-alanine carboxypeptidase/D-alanyl-D-alanine-endopeptidase (penicillin-binding protein 4) [Promicromonospora sukumoe]